MTCNFFIVSYRKNCQDRKEDPAWCSGKYIRVKWSKSLVQVIYKLSVWIWENHLHSTSINLVITCRSRMVVQTLNFRASCQIWISCAMFKKYNFAQVNISVPWLPWVQDRNSNSTYFTRLLRELNNLLYIMHLEEYLKHSNCFSNYMMRTLIYNSVVFKLL